MQPKIDIDGIFTEIRAETSFDYRDPLLPPYGNDAKITPTQRKAWEFINTYDRAHVAVIGAKGSAKTHLGSCFDARMMQKFPGSVGCIISNSYPQAKDNAGPILMKVVQNLGYDIEFYTQKKIRGRPFTNVFVVKLAPGVESFCLIRSFDAVGLLEGIELDWLHAEEVQDADKNDFITVLSRVRGQNADNSVYVAGMPEPESHWQYKLLPSIGFKLAADHDGQPTVRNMFDPNTNTTTKVDIYGIMYEPNLFENVANVGAEYIDRLLSSYSKADAERMVYGRRGGGRGDRVFYAYREDLHRKGNMSKICCHYNPFDPLYVSYDFNVYPMSVGLFQPKPWNDKWDDLIQQGDMWVNPADGQVYGAPNAYCPPDRTIAAQVDEFEIFPDDPEGGMTAGAVVKVERYLDHQGKIIVLGDASGNQRRSSSSTTDWQIIGKSMRKFRDPVVVRGLISKSNLKTGETTYSNPSQRDALQNANRILQDANDQVWVCFLPKSKLVSGGMADAVASLGFKADGSFDTKAERKLDRDVPRSHFADVFKYFCWYFMPPNKASSPTDNRQKDQRDEREYAREHLRQRGGFAF